MASSRRLPVSYNEKTFGSAGYGRNYTSLATWESDTDNNLVTATKGEVLTCYADGSPYNIGSIIIEGATTNSSYFRVIRPVDGEKGTQTSGVRFYGIDGSANTTVFAIREQYFGLYDIGAYFSTNSTNLRFIISSETSNIRTVGCIAWGLGLTNQIVCFAGYTSTSALFINCYATGSGSGTNASGFFVNGILGSVTGYCYNCTSRYNNKGFNNFSGLGQIHLKNCISQNNTTAFASVTSQVTSVSSGVIFEADNYHLSSSDTVAKDNGTDLSADGTFAFDDDIDGNTRSGLWDIGCDEALNVYQEPLSETIISDTVLNDFQTYKEILLNTLISLTSLNDYQQFFESLSNLIISSDNIFDSQSYVENLNDLLQISTDISNLQSYKDNLSEVITSLVFLSNIQSFLDNILATINSITNIDDRLTVLETLIETIISVSSLNDYQEYFESLNTTLQVFYSSTDKYNKVENLNTILVGEISLIDRFTAIENIQIIIESLTEILDKFYRDPKDTKGKITLNFKFQNNITDINIKRKWR